MSTTNLTRRLALAALIAGRSSGWQHLRMAADELIEVCETEDLAPLVYQRLHEHVAGNDWPASVKAALGKRASEAAGEELLRGAETRSTLDALAAAGVRAVLIKGTPLAYTVYPTPASRPREDTDLLIAAIDVDTARDVLASLGFTPTVYCDRLFSQFEVQKIDRFGVKHAYDVHWRISTQPVFADVLGYEEVVARAIPLPALGRSALAPHVVHALLLACIHPVMHHQNARRLLWLYDIFLLASRLMPDAGRRFAQLARERKVAAVCAHQLGLMQDTFNTPIVSTVIDDLGNVSGAEPSAAYLASKRRWQDEVISSVRGLPRFGDRMRLIQQVLLPSPAYMLGAYGLRDNPLAPLMLPALYVHRNVRGAWKVLAGKK